MSSKGEKGSLEAPEIEEVDVSVDEPGWVSVEIDIECAECHAPLEAEWNGPDKKLLVVPCATCAAGVVNEQRTAKARTCVLCGQTWTVPDRVPMGTDRTLTRAEERLIEVTCPKCRRELYGATMKHGRPR